MSQRAMRLLLLAATLAGPIACAARGGGGGGTVNPDPDAGTGDDAPTTSPDVVTPSDNASTCTSPRQMCNGTCVDTSSDTINCGACGVRCSVGQTCSSGACAGGTTCAAPRMMCSGACTDVSSDVNNCGLCGRRCSAGQTCSSSTCTGSTGTCTAPRVMCGTTCVDVSSDVGNCGLCGFACSSGQRCVSGNCTGSTTTCTAPRTMCSSGCTDTSTDPTNCGSCGNRCATGQSCSASRCVTAPTGTTYAGASCSNPDPMGGTDPACGPDLVCIPTGTTPICTTTCEDNSSQATERSMCGGGNSTCLTQGDGASVNSICATACRPAGMTVATGACRTGFVCTGWWYTHAGATPDSPGCFPFCSTNSDCGAGASGSICNARRGSCGTAGPDMTRLPDGSPCNPMMTVMVPGSMTPQNIQCRGICFGVDSADRTRGICGSFINTRVATGCPDDPDNVQPLSRTGADNLAICIFRQCMRNSDCRSPHICRYDEAMGVPATDSPTTCNYPTAAQRTGIP